MSYDVATVLGCAGAEQWVRCEVEMMGERVFVSYSSDDLPTALEVSSALTENGISNFFAKRSIALGADYTATIPAAIAACEVMVVLMSPQAAVSPHVRREVAGAIDNRKHVLPFNLRGGDYLEGIPPDIVAAWNYMLTFYQVKPYAGTDQVVALTSMYSDGLSTTKPTPTLAPPPAPTPASAPTAVSTSTPRPLVPQPTVETTSTRGTSNRGTRRRGAGSKGGDDLAVLFLQDTVKALTPPCKSAETMFAKLGDYDLSDAYNVDYFLKQKPRAEWDEQAIVVCLRTILAGVGETREETPQFGGLTLFTVRARDGEKACAKAYRGLKKAGLWSLRGRLRELRKQDSTVPTRVSALIETELTMKHPIHTVAALKCIKVMAESLD